MRGRKRENCRWDGMGVKYGGGGGGGGEVRWRWFTFVLASWWWFLFVNPLGPLVITGWDLQVAVRGNVINGMGGGGAHKSFHLLEK